MNTANVLLVLYFLLTLAGCNVNAVHDERPARIVGPTEESRAELARAVSEMLFGADVMLAEDALTESSVLIVERNRIRSIENRPLSGRDLGRPERFRLVTTGDRCVLIHENDEARYELLETNCVPE
ncbi:MAG TPA: hypothetical protein VKZ91_05565 [Woeseiaceae bacterium]|nr:hypothetical protein [Woeseiaceae bacterium]